MRTKKSPLTHREICRLNGWKRGTKLVGDEGYGPTIIKITAIGDDSILAVMLSHNGEPVKVPSESTWTLKYRQWSKA